MQAVRNTENEYTSRKVTDVIDVVAYINFVDFKYNVS